MPDQPCITVEPESFEVWLITGTLVYTHPTGLDINNERVLDLGFEILEDKPWLWEDPISGTAPDMSTYNMDIMFTAMYTDMVTPIPLGTYTTRLLIDNDDPVVITHEVPVTMHIVEVFVNPQAYFLQRVRKEMSFRNKP